VEPVPELIQERPRSCWLEIDLDALRHNAERLRARMRPDASMLAVVKAEAYGHGAEMVARTLSRAGVESFGVATLEEALKLRQFGIEDPILILGHLATFTADRILEHNLTPVVFSFRLLQALNEAARKRDTRANVHLKVDTGMGRLGLLPDDLDAFLEEINRLEYVELEGVATHFAEAGENESYTDDQIRSFQSVRKTVGEYDLHPDYWHCMNSAALFSRDEPVGNLVRPGITLYGYSPHGGVPVDDLRPVMQVRTKLADYKQLPAGRGVSYGRTFVPDEPTWIGVMPLGYADGYPRSFSGRAHVLKGGRTCPVLGRVCMDMTIIKLDKQDDPEETVTVMGRDGPNELWATQLADWHDTIPYEILCSFSQRLPRIYLRDGEAIALKTEQTIQSL
jgi:alanine racemase